MPCCAVGRALARAELGGSSVAEAFSVLDKKATDSISHADFWEVSLDPKLKWFNKSKYERVWGIPV